MAHNISINIIVAIFIGMALTVLPYKSDSDVCFVYKYQGLRIDRSLVY